MIRGARFSDIPSLYEAMLSIEHKTNYVLDDSSKSAFHIFMQSHIASHDSRVWVWESGGKAVGVAVGAKSRQFYTNKLTASLLLHFVADGHGGGAYLLRAFLGWCNKDPRTNRIIAAPSAITEDQDRTDMLYTRLIGQPRKLFVKEV